MYKYTPKYKPNQLILGKANDAIVVCGWTNKTILQKKLNIMDYAAIGNLYSAERGITPLLRNLFLNPQIRSLLIFNVTKEDKNNGSCQCLIDFFKYGVDEVQLENKKIWKIISDVNGYIDYEIPLEDLNTLRQDINLFITKSIEEINYILASVNTFEHHPTRSPKDFPENKIEMTVFPGDLYGHRIEGKTIAETWVKLLHRIKTTGTIRPTGYDGQWQELINLMAIVTDEPKDFYFPEPNYLPLDRDFLKNYIPQILEDAPYKEGVKYTYGQRLRSWFGCDQIEDCIKKLIKEIDAASAVMNLWDSGSAGITDEKDYDETQRIDAIARFGRNYGDSDHDHGGSPCLNHIWLRVVNGKLSLTALFRSNDMFSAWPSNAMGLRALQMFIRDEINKRSEYNLELAPLITISQSAHIYDDCWENVDTLLNQIKQQKPDYVDVVGNFIIEVIDDLISVERVDLNGDTVKFYTGNNPLKLLREIAFDAPTIKPDHIGYLGLELQKAYYSIKNNLKYSQDN